MMAKLERKLRTAYTNWALTQANLSPGLVNNKGVDQPEHLFFVHWKVSYLDLLPVKFRFSSLSM